MGFEFLADFGKAFVPKSLRPELGKYCHRAGIKSSPYKFFGVLFYVTLIFTLGVYLFGLWPYIQDQSILVQFFGTLVGWAAIQLLFAGCFILIVYFFLDLKAFQRIQMMEGALPDYFSIVSTNLKGGMSLEHALFSAIKPRFGALAEEMTIISKKVMTGYELQDALEEFQELYGSPMIRRSFSLIIGEIETGGKIAYIIDQIVHNLKQTHKLKMEMSASVISYMIFIGAIVVVIAPALFALSYHLLSFISAFTVKLAGTGVSATANLPFKFSEEGLDTESFRIFSFVAITLVSFFSSLIVSIIEKGNIKGGIKYIPIFMIGAIVAYSVFMLILGAVFSGIVI